MPLVSRTLPGLFNGVSQQPDTMRLDTQCEAQENAMSLLVDGLTKRPNTEWVASLDTDAEHSSFVHAINRDTQERYIVVFTNGEVEVFTLDGVKCTVIYDPGTTAYITGTGNPKDFLKAVTVADHTIIVNNQIVPQMLPPTPPPDVTEALVWVQRGVASVDYGIEVTHGSSTYFASFTTGSAQNDPETFRTTKIAEQLADGLETSFGTGPWEVTLIGSTILIQNTDGEEFSIRVKDGYGNQAMKAYKGTAQRFQDLPPEAPDGMVLKVEGDADSDFDNFYVKFVQNEDGSGVWQETVKPGIETEFDPETLPHRLIRSGVNEFTLKQIEWEPRLVGDESSAPKPSFMEGPIRDVFFFKNRLGFLSGENVVLSRSGDFFNFWPSTAMDVLDGDPIDVAVSTNRVAILHHAVPFTNSLLLFSDQQQIILSSGGGPLTPSTAAIDPATAFESSKDCKPVGAGPNVYFVVPSGRHSRIREYFVQTNAVSNDAADVTAHVPRYLPRITHLASSSSRDLLFAISEEEPHNVYVYSYYWDGDNKAQSSWSRWSFSDEVIGLEVIDSWVFMVMRREDEKFLVRLNLENIPTGTLPFRIHLDKLIPITVPENLDLIPPYDEDLESLIVVDGETGSRLLDTVVTPDRIIVPSKYRGKLVYVGKPYTMLYRFSKWYLRDENGIANIQGRLQLRTLSLSFNSTGYFRLEVTPFRRDTLVQEYTATILGVSELGSPSIVSGEKRFPVLANSYDTVIDLYNDSYLPSQIQSASFEGFWTARSRPL